MLASTIRNHAVTLRRGLGLLLVVFIFYGTTVEAAHRHGRIPTSNGHASILNDSGETTTPLGSNVGCGDCLICQLHQNFNSTVIAFQLADPPSRPQLKAATILPRNVHSQVTGPSAGRAPPSIS